MSKRLFMIFLVVMVSLLAGACDIFQTRDPEPPSQGTSSYLPPDQPATVLDNFRTSVAEANADNYARSLSDSGFVFIPSAEVAARYASTFRVWNAGSERTYFRNLGTPLNGTPQLTFSNLQQSRISSDSILYTMDYSFYYPHRRAGIPKLVSGKMQLDMRPNASRLWYVATWHDFKTSSDSTWSYLKAVFSEN